MSPRLRFYIGLVAAAAPVALAMAARQAVWDFSSQALNGFVAIFAIALAAELSAFRSQGGSTFSLAFIPFLAAGYLFGPFWAMVLAGANELAVDWVFRRKPWFKTLFNTAKEMLAVGAAAGCFLLLGGKASLYGPVYAPQAVFLGGVTYFAINSGTVAYAVSLSEGIPFGTAWSRANGGEALLYDLFAVPLTVLLAYLYVRYQLMGVAALVLPLFIVRHVYAMNIQLNQTNRDLLVLMVKAIEARDPYTSGHSQRVAQYARLLAREAGLHGKQLEHIYTAALLHDVGKIYEDYAPVLRKEGKLTPEERALLQTHPVRSAELVSTISSLKGPVEQAVRFHHENYNGTGYPSGLAAEEIPIGARVIMIADTLDAMTTDRPYRKALPFERALQEFQKYAGIQFDPRLVTVAGKSAALKRVFGPAHQAVESPMPVPAPTISASVDRVAERV